MADESNPGTQPFVPDFDDDSGEPSEPFVPNFDDTDSQPLLALAGLTWTPEGDEAPASAESPDAAATEPGADAPEVLVTPVAVPGRYQYVKSWRLLLVLLATWVAAAEVGLSLFYWWYHTVDKTAALFVMLVYIVACTAGGVMVAMVHGRPLITALALGLMSGPFASAVAATPLYGYYYCERVGHCLAGFVPY